MQTYLASAECANSRAKLGDWVSANKGARHANVASPIDKLSVQILQDTSAVFRFDGSDLMPAAVGSGTFWKGMAEWINGKDTAPVLQHREQLALSSIPAVARPASAGPGHRPRWTRKESLMESPPYEQPMTPPKTSTYGLVAFVLLVAVCFCCSTWCRPGLALRREASSSPPRGGGPAAARRSGGRGSSCSSSGCRRCSCSSSVSSTG